MVRHEQRQGLKKSPARRREEALQVLFWSCGARSFGLPGQEECSISIGFVNRGTRNGMGNPWRSKEKGIVKAAARFCSMCLANDRINWYVTSSQNQMTNDHEK